MKYLLLSCFWVTSLVGFAQNPNQIKYFVDNTRMESTADSRIDVNAYGDTVMYLYFRTNLNPNSQNERTMSSVFKGTPYLKHKWANGVIYIDGQNPQKVFMAYNMQKERAYVMFPKIKEAIELWPDGIDFEGVSLRKYAGVYENASKSYYQQVYSGNVKVFKEYRCRLNAENIENNNGYVSSNKEGFSGEFVQYQKYYLLVDNSLQLFGTNKKFAKLLPQYNDQMEQYLKDNKLTVAHEPDLQKALQYYDSLVETRQ